MFNDYTPGEPSMRLYVKNLTKNVTEKIGETPHHYGHMCDAAVCLFDDRTWSIYLDDT